MRALTRANHWDGTLARLSVACVVLLGAAGPRAAACEAVGDIRFVCDLISPEDLAVVPDSDWVIASGNQEGGAIHLVSVSNKTTRPLYPTSRERFDTATYPTCPGPIDPAEKEKFRAHGLYLRPGQNAVHTLYVVHHGSRESVEVFEFDGNATPPALTWVGCAVTPETLTLNAVVALPEGGFAATGPSSGAVWEWHTDPGWSLVPGSRDTAPNGLEISKDGRWFYIAGWRIEKVTRLSRGRTPVRRDVVWLGFRPDNLRLAPDGFIYAAGHRNFMTPDETSNVGKINPDTLHHERIFEHPYIEGFAAATTAIPIGDEMWLGTNRGEMIAYFKR